MAKRCASPQTHNSAAISFPRSILERCCATGWGCDVENVGLTEAVSCEAGCRCRPFRDADAWLVKRAAAALCNASGGSWQAVQRLHHCQASPAGLQA